MVVVCIICAIFEAEGARVRGVMCGFANERV